MSCMDQELANFFEEVDQAELEVKQQETKVEQKVQPKQQPQQQRQKLQQQFPPQTPKNPSSFANPLPPPTVPPPTDHGPLPPPSVPPPSVGVPKGAELGPKIEGTGVDAQIMLGPQPLMVMPSVRGVSGTAQPLPLPEQKPLGIEVKPPIKNDSSNKNSKGQKRMAAGKIWWDASLSEWPPNDFRLFVGDLGNEVTDEVLSKAFSRYPSFQKAKVVRHKRTNKTKGFGFVSFGDAVEGHKALKEMDGKYIGNRPCKLKKSSWGERNIDSDKNKQEMRLKRQKLGVQQI